MASRNRLKCIFIGFGTHAQKYADTFKELNLEITSIFVRNKRNYNFYKNKYKINKIYNNLENILKLENYDFVMVMLPWNIIEKQIFKIIKHSKTKLIFQKNQSHCLKKN